MSDTFKIHGLVRASEVPQEWTTDDIRYWWCDEHDDTGHLLRRAAMPAKERLKYAVYEAENLIVNAGISNILTLLSTTPTNLMIVSQRFSAGNGAIAGVDRTDTTVVGEGGLTNNRQGSAGYTITGSQTDIAFVYAGSDGQGAWTNVGLYGQGASTADGTGILQTHALYSYNKPNATITIDYIISLSN